jgi:hypothetical protein
MSDALYRLLLANGSKANLGAGSIEFDGMTALSLECVLISRFASSIEAGRFVEFVEKRGEEGKN